MNKTKNDPLSERTFTPGMKPVQSLERLINVCVPFALPLDTSQGEVLVNMTNSDNEPLVIIILTGEMRIYRKSDNLLYALMAAPIFLGVLGSEFRKETFDFIAAKKSTALTIPREHVIDLVTEHNLVRDLLAYYTYVYDHQTYHADLMISRTAYEIICGLLCELALLPDEHRLKISVANYILYRSNLARSGVLKIIASLREGRYVDIKNGKLISILKKFPASY